MQSVDKAAATVMDAQAHPDNNERDLKQQARKNNKKNKKKHNNGTKNGDNNKTKTHITGNKNSKPEGGHEPPNEDD